MDYNSLILSNRIESAEGMGQWLQFGRNVMIPESFLPVAKEQGYQIFEGKIRKIVWKNKGKNTAFVIFNMNQGHEILFNLQVPI